METKGSTIIAVALCIFGGSIHIGDVIADNISGYSRFGEFILGAIGFVVLGAFFFVYSEFKEIESKLAQAESKLRAYSWPEMDGAIDRANSGRPYRPSGADRIKWIVQRWLEQSGHMERRP